MNLVKSLIFTLTLLYLDVLHACPGCAGSMGSKRDSYTVYILMVFIGLTYIPFFVLYRTIIKHRKGVAAPQAHE
ncbi:MAG: hypothetical protein EP319_03340 [Deltaproteobacteria bacterium]|jgi:hypothetical protein|nr:MAG: hypothetical protein EP319_03340 [Deltaproteobacteria bacterium]